MICQQALLSTELYQARVTQRPIAPFTDREPSLGMAEGYAIQRELVDMLLAAWAATMGQPAYVTGAVAESLGSARTFRQWVADHPGVFSPG